MTLLDQIRDAVAEVQGDDELNAVRFRHTGTFQHVQNGRERNYPCRFSVKDPSRMSRDAVAAAVAFADSLEGVTYRDIRLLAIHPDDARPPRGAVLTTPWDGGRLEVLEWNQPSDFTGQAVGSCVLRR